MTDSGASVIEVTGLNYAYKGGMPVLFDVNMKMPKGARCLLVGANGTGKSTLLRILAGKKLVHSTKCEVLGHDPFQSTPNGLTYLGSEWANNPITRQDMRVTQLIRSSGGNEHRERRDRLLDILDINPNWRMHEVSDGERRRVQLLLGLMKPFDCLLLDEVTVDLDVLVRSDLLNYLKRETEERGASILYATHIFDGIGDWCTHLCHLSNGHVRLLKPVDDIEELVVLRAEHRNAGYGESALLRLVEQWLREEFEQRKKARWTKIIDEDQRNLYLT
ncbi:hypothetical protein SARC_11396 [Sphaeroforma arctica JP610]|uniref:ABC transporter domain-containing protein n=1 Tax=Sphaeroforma arctica JP610 TaxID=667725 RepID=A0A0L0FJB4_9EUKA|nr:hypothetical protein SARC_11396 [Sphaeroforma arctica JP610]KNC76093.1 hypothetical protein SARC_11396 [Sphaeroforma arctica JP610]|eukprot:XP_014149995.1 hypothetical protein SARC_11396 [Sphaeroforma arctica JP610]